LTSLVLVDTDILIDAGRGIPLAVAFLARQSEEVMAISAVTRMELIVGCRNRSELRTLDRFLRAFRVFALTPEITQKAEDLLRQYRLSHGLLIPDALIAATAVGAGVALATKNLADFRFIDGLQLAAYG
jgi:predicted nucleic acid-binding protein